MPGSRKVPFVVDEYYHVFNRGIDKRIIFSCPENFERFMMLLYVCNSTIAIELNNLIRFDKKTFEKVLMIPRGEQFVSIGCWCLMDNHFHLLIKEVSEGGITKFMTKLGTGYSMYFNAKYKRTGSLFGGRFKSVHIENDTHLRHLFGYIHLNPLDIGFPKWDTEMGKYSQKEMQDFLISYRYSSYQEYCEHAEVRPESVVIDKKTFPEYFSQSNSFNGFIEHFLSK